MADVTSCPFPDRKTPAGFRDASAGPTGFRTGSLYAVWIVRVCSYALCALTPPRHFTHQTLGHPPPFPGGTSCFFFVFLLIV